MKKKLPILGMLLFLAAAIVFCALWQQERKDHSDLELLGQTSARSALDNFGKSESDAMYWQGVADFRAFMQAHSMLTEGEGSFERFTCGKAYAALVFHPEEARAHLDVLAAALELLSKNIYDMNGFLRLTEFHNAVLR